MKIKELFESAYSAGVSDGMRGQEDRRASSKYGPETNQYFQGYVAGLKKKEEKEQEAQKTAAAEREKYASISQDDLEAEKERLDSLRDKIRNEMEQARGSGFSPRSDFHQKKTEIYKKYDVNPNQLADEYRKISDELARRNTEEPPIDEGTRCWEGYEKKGMKTMFGKRVPNCVKKESIEVDDEGAIAIVNFKKTFDWNKVSNLADRFGIGMDVLDNNTTHGEPGKYYLQADFYDDIDEFGEILYFKYDNELISMDELTEDLKKWFGKGKKGGAGGGGWDAYNSKGERIGKCGETSGRAKPKCLSKSKAASLRNSDANDDGKKDGKAGIARAVKRKRRKDPNPDREGKAKNVKNKE